MYTQCPKCQTVFRVTMEQLSAHQGTVRCGHCDNVFNADRYLYFDIQSITTPEKKSSSKKKSGAKPKQTKATPSSVRQELGLDEDSIPSIIEVTAAPPPVWMPPPEPPVEISMPPMPEPIIEEVSLPPIEKKPSKSTKPRARQKKKESPPALLAPWLLKTRRRGSPSWLWIGGSALLFFTFVAQATFFYRDQLAGYPPLRPYVFDACHHIGCNVRPPYDLTSIELIQPTNMTPHPRTPNALRLRATMVNRAGKNQPLPLMQITLTDGTNRMLSRRLFAPREYLEQPSLAETDMASHLAIGALLDITNPDGKAVGYEIEFIAPPIR